MMDAASKAAGSKMCGAHYWMIILSAGLTVALTACDSGSPEGHEGTDPSGESDGPTDSSAESDGTNDSASVTEGTDTPDESDEVATTLVGFAASDCKDGVEGEKRVVSGLFNLYTMADSRDLDGLQCVSWKHDGVDRLTVDLINFPSGCGIVWNGEVANPGAHQVELILENELCGIASCGACIYDWSFEVAKTSPDQDMALTISVWSYARTGCELSDPADALTSYTLAIPKDALSNGITCGYVNPIVLEWRQKVNGLNLPCGDQCDEGLVCAQNPEWSEQPEDNGLCLMPCTPEEAICPYPDLMSCIDGLCQLSEIWEG